MKRRSMALVVGLGLLMALSLLTVSTAGAADSIKKTVGMVLGHISKTSWQEVAIIGNSGTTETIPVNEIKTIAYEEDPTSLRTARTNILTGHYEDALEALADAGTSDVSRLEIKQDIAFFKAYCLSQMALSGSGTIMNAGREMSAFVKTHTGSYHWLRANEILGDLGVASGNYAAAVSYYSRLGKAPWPDYKMRSAVAVGRAQLAQGLTAEASRSFDTALAIPADDDQGKAQHLAATLGKASCLASENKLDEAVGMVEAIIAKSDPEQKELNARAYNTLGTALRKGGKPKEAVIAFLHVHVLYPNSPEDHAEALANLTQLWTELHQATRALDSRKLLQERYPNSQWAKKGG